MIKECFGEVSPHNDSFRKVRDVSFKDANILFYFMSILFE